MYIYKLFYTRKNVPKFDRKYFVGQSKQAFAVEINPENYCEFMDNYYPIFRNNKVEQHIMTNYKFLRLIKDRERLGIDILNLNFSLKGEQKSNENYVEFLKQINRRRIDLAYSYLELLIQDGFEISQMECSIKHNTDYLRLNINKNGTISFPSSLNLMGNLLKNNLVIDYLVKGPTVLS
jgi:hypothetical protein